MAELVKHKEGLLGRWYPPSYQPWKSEGGFVPSNCPDHLEAELIVTRQHHSCDCSWSCKCPRLTITHTCSVEGCNNQFRDVI